MRRWSWVVALFLLASACGGGSTGDNAAGVVVESADGLATLWLAPGSLPEGVSFDDVQLDVLVDETAEPGAPMMMVRLSPDGLVLGEPAELTVPILEALEGGFMAIHTSGDVIEFLVGEIEVFDGALSFTTSLEHFSDVHLSPAEFFEDSVSTVPGSVAVGETQDASATIQAKPTVPHSRWFSFGSDPPGTWRQFRLSGPEPPFSFGDARIMRIQSQRWNPATSQKVEFSKTDSGWESSIASATCLAPDNVGVRLWVNVTFGVTMIERGEPVTPEFTVFAQTLTQQGESPELGFSNSSVTPLLDLAPGETFLATAVVVEDGPGLCVAASASGTAGTTPKTDTSATTGASAGPPGTNIIGVSHSVGPDDSHVYTIELDGDGKTLASTESGDGYFDIIIDGLTDDGEEWSANTTFFGSDTSQNYGVVIGPSLPDAPRESLKGATVTATWTSDSTLEVTVEGGGDQVQASQFMVSISVDTDDGGPSYAQTDWQDGN